MKFKTCHHQASSKETSATTTCYLLSLTKKENVRYFPFELLLGNLLKRNLCYYQLLPLTKKENVRYLPFKLLLQNLFRRNLCYYQLLPLTKKENVRYLPFQVAFREPLQKEPLLQPAATSHKGGERKVPTLSSCFWGTSSKGTSATTSFYLSQRRRT